MCSSDLFAARIDASGAAIETNGFPVAELPLNQMRPRIASGGQNFVVTWEDQRSGLFFDIYAARISANGTVLDRDGLLLSRSENYETFSGSAWNGTNYLVAWRDLRNGSKFEIYAARISQSGLLLDPSGVRVANSANFNSYPSVASAGGDFLIVWEDTRIGADHDIFGARVNAGGVLLDANSISICTNAGSQQFQIGRAHV